MSRKKKHSIQQIQPEAAQKAALERFKPLLAPDDFQLDAGGDLATLTAGLAHQPA